MARRAGVQRSEEVSKPRLAPRGREGQDPPRRPPRPKRLLLPEDEERYPNLDRHPATKRALLVHRAMQAGMARDEALAYVDGLMGAAAPPRAGRRSPRPPRTAAAAVGEPAPERPDARAPARRRRRQ
ncbi:MAG TPA: hypothetical protein VFH47_05290 [Candidatus Thermoplasmatota archaeon]|nr:hypothetical protein [Candidatus Thermoplasmatota archaeon]